MAIRYYCPPLLLFALLLTLAANIPIAVKAQEKSASATNTTLDADTSGLEDTDIYQQLAQQIESSISEGEPLILNEAFDKAQMLDKILTFTQKQTDKTLEIDKNQLLKDFSDNFNIGEQVTEWVGIDGFYDFIIHHKKDNKNYLLFRLYGKNGGLNYHDFELADRTDTLKITDIYIYLAGDYISNIMGQIFLPLLTADNANNNNKRETFLQAINTLDAVKQQTAIADYQQAAQLFEQIPNELKQQKTFQLTLLAFADKISPQYYQTAIDNYEKQYPNDPSLQLILLNKLFLQKNYTQTLQCIDQLAQKVFNDPFLNFQRANTYWAMADTTNALNTAQKLINDIPDFIDGHLTLLIYAIEAQKYDIALSEMQTMVEWFSYEKSTLEQMLADEFPQFIRSETFQKWEPTQNDSERH